MHRRWLTASVLLMACEPDLPPPQPDAALRCEHVTQCESVNELPGCYWDGCPEPDCYATLDSEKLCIYWDDCDCVQCRHRFVYECKSR